MNASRLEILDQIAALIVVLDHPHPLRVAIDGVDAAGKTTLANELVPLIEQHGRPVIRVSVDGFHNSREVRYQRGADSPEGYYRDSFNYDAILQDVLIPLGPGGSGIYRPSLFDFRANKTTYEPPRVAPPNAVLLFDGVFLLRPELVDHWEFSVFVDVDFDVSVPRAVRRDVAQSGGKLNAKLVREKYNRRYVPGQRIYMAEANPISRVNVVFNNDNIAAPVLRMKDSSDD